MPGTECQRLKDRLYGLPPGPVKIEMVPEIEFMLVDCWDQLDVDREGGMQARKLSGRTKNMEWQQPILDFEIERHGSTALGSIYADMQGWTINLDDETASVYRSGRRVLGQRSPPWKAGPVVEELVAHVSAGAEDSRIKWIDAGTVKFLVSEIVPGESKPTLVGRRKRFRATLEEKMRTEGWELCRRYYTYCRVRS